jgi:hypothetical protein
MCHPLVRVLKERGVGELFYISASTWLLMEKMTANENMICEC